MLILIRFNPNKFCGKSWICIKKVIFTRQPINKCFSLSFFWPWNVVFQYFKPTGFSNHQEVVVGRNNQSIREPQAINKDFAFVFSSIVVEDSKIIKYFYHKKNLCRQRLWQKELQLCSCWLNLKLLLLIKLTTNVVLDRYILNVFKLYNLLVLFTILVLFLSVCNLHTMPWPSPDLFTIYLAEWNNHYFCCDALTACSF